MKALVLSGGGVHGAFQVGVLKQLAKKYPQNFKYQIYSGISVGALNASWLAQYDNIVII